MDNLTKAILDRVGFALLGWLVTLALMGAAPETWAIEAGASKVDITPPLGAPMNGYGDRLGRGATEVHDPLTARCVYLRDEDTQLFLVTTDLCIINRELRDAVLAAMPPIVPPENVIITATHNHNGTGGMVRSLLFRTISGPYRQDLVDFTAHKIVVAMEEAFENRTRATIAYGTTKQDVLTVNRQNADGPRDSQIGVIKIENADGAPIAIIGNMAAHPTTVPDADRYAISADYPGFYYAELERLAGEPCVALFLNGAEGNQRCANPEGHDDPWDRMESIGRLLAIRVKEVANRLDGDKLPIDVRSAVVDLPPTLANRWVPNDVFLQTLQIGGLLLTFFPGEPCVEIGLEMRKRALAAGYDAHFTVGLANDHLLYFVPASLYATEYYESAMSLFGPEVEDWFYTHFTALMSPESEVIATDSRISAPQDGDILTFDLGGSPRDWGRARADAIGRERMEAAFERHIVAQVRDRSLLADMPLIDSLPAFIDATPAALPLLAIGVRAPLANVPEAFREEMTGLAARLDMPFDAVYLLQLAPSFAAMGGPGAGLSLPFCTMAAIPTENGPLVARTFDWVVDESMAVARYTPEVGQAYMTIGPAWSLGGFSGMNASGVVMVAERVEAFGRPSGSELPIEFILRAVIATATSADAARSALAESGLPNGYTILVSDGEQAFALRPGGTTDEDVMTESPLLAIAPGTSGIGIERASRYRALSERLRNMPATTEAQLSEVFAQREGEGDAAILNEGTRFFVVFHPRNGSAQLFSPDEEGGWNPPTHYSLPQVVER